MARFLSGLWLLKFSRRPIWPALLSALVAPGVGQIYNRDIKRGLLLLLLSLGSFFWFSTVLTEQMALHLPGNPETWSTNTAAFKQALFTVVRTNPGMFVSFYTLMILTWGFGVVDAYVSARKKRSEPPSNEIADLER